MHKQLLIVMLICLKGADYISAQQWTKKDSVWLQNVLSGKEKLELQYMIFGKSNKDQNEKKS